MKYLGMFLIVLAGAFAVAAQGTQNGRPAQNDRFTGTWKLNVAKSKFNPGPAPKGEKVTIAPDKVTVEETTTDSKTSTGPIPPHPEPQRRSSVWRTRV